MKMLTALQIFFYIFLFLAQFQRQYGGNYKGTAGYLKGVSGGSKLSLLPKEGDAEMMQPEEGTEDHPAGCCCQQRGADTRNQYYPPSKVVY